MQRTRSLVRALPRGGIAELLVLVAVTWGCFVAAPTLSAAAANRPLHVVVLGDSLSAGLGLGAAEAFPSRLEAALRKKGLTVAIANAGVSGDTAADGLARLDWSVPDGTDAVIVELGANDALRGIDPDQTRKDLQAILARLRQRGLAVLLCGMLAPRNLGEDYDRRFDAIYPQLAADEGVLLYPFFLDGVATDPKLNQHDGMHPNAAGVDIVVGRILPKVQDLIATAKAKRAASKAQP